MLRLFAAAALVSIIVTAGCGPGHPPAYPTKGRVVFANGSPVKTGTVELKSREHKVQARGTIDSDGWFTLTTYQPNDGAVAGAHDCVVVQMILGEDIGRTHGSLGVVHPKHAAYHSSQLTCTVEPKSDNVITLTVAGVGKLVEGGSEKDHKIPKS